MRRIFLISLLILTTVFARGQQYFLDSLKTELNRAKNDTQRVIHLGMIAEYYSYVRLDSSFYYATQMISLSQSINYDYGRFLGRRSMFFSMITSGNYPKALEFASANLRIAESLKIDQNLNLARAHHDIGLVYRIMGYDAVAMSQFRQAEYFDQKVDSVKSDMRFAVFLNFAILYQRARRYDSAFFYAKKGYDALLHSDYARRGALPAAVLANLYEQTGNDTLALRYYWIGIESAREYNNDYILARLYNNIARYFRKKSINDSCLYYAKNALLICQKGNFGDYAADASSILGSVYEIQHQADSALKYTKLMVAFKDSVFGQSRRQQFELLSIDEDQRQREASASKERFRNQVKLYGLLTAAGILLLLAGMLYRNNRLKQKSYNLLDRQKQEIDLQKERAENALVDLKSTQAQLIQSEKMASLGELTAGIAHEIQNPLNFVNNFSDVNRELVAELQQEIDKGNYAEVKSIAQDIVTNECKINEHGKRADAIVKSMLQHSSTNSTKKELISINSLCDEYLRLSYHGMRAKDKNLAIGQAGLEVALKTDFDAAAGEIKITPQDIGRVLLNLFNNAFYALSEKKKLQQDFDPEISVATRRTGNKIEIIVQDNGTGVPDSVKEKIFQPFFTTKPTGQGTGLGLSLSYDIIKKGHNGELKMESVPMEGSTFTVVLFTDR